METVVMDKKPSKLHFKFTKKNIIISSLITFILIMLALTAQLSYMTLNYDKVYKGVNINNIYVGGLSKSELTSLLEKNYTNKVKTTSLLLKTPKYSETVNYSGIDVRYDVQKVVDQAFKIGRTGSIIDKLYDIFQAGQDQVYLVLPFSYDSGKLNVILDSLKAHTLLNVKDFDLYIQDKDQKVSIQSGHHGESIDMDKILSQIEATIKSCKGGTIKISIIVTAPGKINVEDIYNQIKKVPSDAKVDIVNNKLIFTPEVFGRDIDKTVLASISTELENSENVEKVLPVTFIPPKKTLLEIQAQLFKDELYTKTTLFKTRNANELNRSVNIRLDTAKINGTILAPGQIFSYNTVVGKKTYEQGYKDAFTYVAGKQVPGMGGGICQVSSTLYNAVLYSDLQVLQRRNHMFEVFYVPFGQDATVYYGSTDFQFKNSTNWPLEINCSVTTDNKVIFSLLGTNENPGKSVQISSKPLGPVVPFPIRYIDDPLVKKDQIVQSGHDGGTFETYKTVLQDGKVISSKRISVSTYKPLEQVIKRVPPVVIVPTPIPAADLAPINPDVVP